MKTTLNYKEITRGYGLYLCGMTLEKAAKRIGTTRQILWNKFKALGLPTRARATAGLTRKAFEFNGAKYYKSGKEGQWRKGIGNRSCLARDMWVFYKGPIPEFHEIRYIDKNKDNHVIENLICVMRGTIL